MKPGKFAMAYWKHNGFAQPTPFQIIKGMEKIYVQGIRDSIKDKPKSRIERIIKDYETYVWDNLMSYAMIIDPYTALTVNDYFNPKNPTVCLILWLMSVDPIFYQELNKAVISCDEFQYFDTVGPLALAVYWITQYTEEQRYDKLPSGTEIENSPLADFSCCQIYFRAVHLTCH